MAGVHDGKQVLPLPTPADIAEFETRFGSVESWRKKLTNIQYSDARGMDKVNALRSAERLQLGKRGTIASAISRVNDHHLNAIFSAILEAGLARFLPDLLGSPDSLYNSVHEDLAIESFQRVAVRKAYPIDITNVRDVALVRRLYRHFFFYHMYEKVKSDQRDAGAVERRIEMTNVYKRRLQDAIRRNAFLKADGWPKVTRGLVKYAECNSEDERNIDGTFTKIPHEMRSKTAAQFNISIDKRIKATVQAQNSYTIRRRVVAENPPPPKCKRRVALGAPIDWFDPDIFNKFSARMRYAIYCNGIALPPARFWLLDQDAEFYVPDHFKTMSADEFNTQYADEVLQPYNIPTQEELENVDYDGMSQEENEPDENEPDDNEPEENLDH
ncbi:hypothetical protein C8F01DRAFT_1260516 [Mycena amicta]|nr:hypothetical protein C8F01DRAFT_1260516 [Mycena amicta]